MKYRYFLGKDISQLGFGATHLPVSAHSGEIDFKETVSLVGAAAEGGINYFDTAYQSHASKSEEVLGRALDECGCLESVYIATKLPTTPEFLEGDFNGCLHASLARLRRSRIDFYLLDELDRGKWARLKGAGILRFFEQAKREGLLGHVGFAIQDRFEAFKSILDDYDWEFCQIPYNFMDAESQPGLEGLAYASSKNIPVAASEPLKGGRLTRLTDEYSIALKSTWGLGEHSIARCALRYVLDEPSVMVAVSGMSKMEHLAENIETASQTNPASISASERAFLDALRIYVQSKDAIPCTNCGNCLAECPQSIDISGVFGAYNDAVRYNSADNARREAGWRQSNATDCQSCGSCRQACPQNLDIPALLSRAATWLGLGQAT